MPDPLFEKKMRVGSTKCSRCNVFIENTIVLVVDIHAMDGDDTFVFCPLCAVSLLNWIRGKEIAPLDMGS